MVQHEDQVASDMYCLVGRIYKDMFLDSNFTDEESRDKGIYWSVCNEVHSLLVYTIGIILSVCDYSKRQLLICKTIIPGSRQMI